MSLRRIVLRDFVIVPSLDLDLDQGFNVLTGETGAGKSILIDALQLALGARADSGVVRHGADRAELVADFTLDDVPAAFAWLRENELDEDNGCQIRRVIRAEDQATRCGWTPFDGFEAKGWPLATIIRGQLIMQEGQLVTPSAGEPIRFLEALTPTSSFRGNA